jgi:exosortase/archaeosortase family protein
MLSPANTPNSGLLSRAIVSPGSFAAPRSVLLALTLVLAAVAADQFAAPILRSSSPLWATTACLLLVWRRGKIPGDRADQLSISIGRLAAFLAAHGAIVLLARSLSTKFQAASGAMTVAGTLVAATKLCVLLPAMLLFSLPTWKKVAAIYFPEAIAALVVLLTFFPSRALQALWPWYGQLLGRLVHTLSRVFVPGLAYLADSNPTLSGPDLDVTIIPECSGINGLELFDYLFGVVVFLDWNRLCKGRALLAYGAGLFAMLLGNAVRITSFVVLGNHGFAESVARFHISAGWIFFSAVFLVYLSMTYRGMLGKRDSAAPDQ